MKPNFNYINLINAFDTYIIAEKLSIYEIAVFNYLKAKINWNFWRPNFAIATSKICKELNISRPTFIKARENLKQRNLIDFSNGNIKKHAVYNLIPQENWTGKKINNINDFCQKFINNEHKINKKNFCPKNTQQNQISDNEKNFNSKITNQYSVNSTFSCVNLVYTKSLSCVNQVYTYKDSKKNIYSHKYFKNRENDFSLCEKSKKNASVFFVLTQNQNSKNKKTNPIQKQEPKKQTVITKSVNSQEEKRKKVAQKKEKRFLAKKEPFNHKTTSSEVIVPKTNKSTLNRPKRALKCILPADEQVKMYIAERGNKISANQFIAYCRQKDRKTSKHWRLLVKQWERNKRKNELLQNSVTNNAGNNNNSVTNNAGNNNNSVTNNAGNNEVETSIKGSEKPLNTLDKPKQRTAKKSVFIVPTMQEIEDFCKQEQLTHVSTVEFFNHYESLDWMVGKNKMKNWKSAARGWNARTQRWATERAETYNKNKKTYVKTEENIEPTIGRMKLSDVKKMMTGWD